MTHKKKWLFGSLVLIGALLIAVLSMVYLPTHAAPARPLVAQPDGTVPFLRLYNPTTGDHFYTIDQNEAKAAEANGYILEGTLGLVFFEKTKGTTQLFRAYNRTTSDHFYTSDRKEWRNAAKTYGYTKEGVACYIYPLPVAGASAPAGTVKVYRFYGNGHHFYTTTEQEGIAAGLTEETSPGYVYPA